jgi:hypothetical protein
VQNILEPCRLFHFPSVLASHIYPIGTVNQRPPLKEGQTEAVSQDWGSLTGLSSAQLLGPLSSWSPSVPWPSLHHPLLTQLEAVLEVGTVGSRTVVIWVSIPGPCLSQRGGGPHPPGHQLCVNVSPPLGLGRHPTGLCC